MLFLYDIPVRAMSAVIVSATLLIVLGGYVLFRRVFPITFDTEQHNATIAMITAIATINSLLVAFSATSVQGACQATIDIVATEAARATELARNLSVFSYLSAIATRNELITYLQHVMRDEWPSMQQHAHPDVNTEAVFDIMSVTADRIAPRDDRKRVLPVEVLTRVNEMVRYRERRLQNLEAAMSDTLWGVMLIANGLSLLLLHILPATHSHMALMMVRATTFSLVFFSALAMDRPFAGEVGVSAASLERVIRMLSNDNLQAHPGLG